MGRPESRSSLVGSPRNAVYAGFADYGLPALGSASHDPILTCMCNIDVMKLDHVIYPMHTYYMSYGTIIPIRLVSRSVRMYQTSPVVFCSPGATTERRWTIILGFPLTRSHWPVMYNLASIFYETIKIKIL